MSEEHESPLEKSVGAGLGGQASGIWNSSILGGDRLLNTIHLFEAKISPAHKRGLSTLKQTCQVPN